MVVLQRHKRHKQRGQSCTGSNDDDDVIDPASVLIAQGALHRYSASFTVPCLPQCLDDGNLGNAVLPTAPSPPPPGRRLKSKTGAVPGRERRDISHRISSSLCSRVSHDVRGPAIIGRRLFTSNLHFRFLIHLASGHRRLREQDRELPS